MAHKRRHAVIIITVLQLLSWGLHESNAFQGSLLKYDVEGLSLNGTPSNACEGYGEACVSSCPRLRGPPDLRLVQQDIRFDAATCGQQGNGDHTHAEDAGCLRFNKTCFVEFHHSLDRIGTVSLIIKPWTRDGRARTLLQMGDLVVSVVVNSSTEGGLIMEQSTSTSTINFSYSSDHISIILQLNETSNQVFISGSRVRSTGPVVQQSQLSKRIADRHTIILGRNEGSPSSFIGTIQLLDVFQRTMNESEILNEAQYASQLATGALYPQCTCGEAGLGTQLSCADGSSRLGLSASLPDWFFLSPLGLSDGVKETTQRYGYWTPQSEEYLVISLGHLYEVTGVMLYGNVQDVHAFQHQDGLWFSLFCSAAVMSLEWSCNASRDWHTPEGESYQQLSWKPQVLPVVTDSLLIHFLRPKSASRDISEIEVYGRMVNQQIGDECICFPGNGMSLNGTCDECGHCACRDGFTSSNKFCSPTVTSIWPTAGPAKGGTLLTVQGELLLPLADEPKPTITLGHGHVCHVNHSISNDTHLVCTTASILHHDSAALPMWRADQHNSTHQQLPQRVTLNLSVGITRVPLSTTFSFNYLANPVFEDVSPLKTFLRGGLELTLTGQHISSQLEPAVRIVETYNGVVNEHPASQACEVRNSTLMVCEAPVIRLARRKRRSEHSKFNTGQNSLDSRSYLNSDRRTFVLAVDLVGLPGYASLPSGDGKLFEVYEDPIIYQWQPEIQTFKVHQGQTIIRITGHNLRNGCESKDYNVTIGDVECLSISIPYDNELLCYPPTSLQDPGPVTKNGAALVRVRVGYLDVAVGYLRYEHTIWDDSHFVHQVVGGTVGGVVFVLVSLVVCFCIRLQRRRKQERKQKQIDLAKEMLRYEALTQDRSQDLMDSLPEDLREEIKECLIDQKDLQLQNPIGEGNFGKVYLGELDSEGMKTKVAVKTLRENTGSIREVVEFLQEATIMRGFSHPNVLTMYGVVLDHGQTFVVLPFMQNGDLKTYMSTKAFSGSNKLRFCSDIAKGMSYLAEHKFVHRDLAARNCMVDATERILVADFGLARDIYEKDYYRVEDMTRPMPFKWMALEALRGFTFTSKSDVWSYGVLMWEIFTGGRKPYADVENRHIRLHLSRGNRLEQPRNCPDQVYDIMKKCWHEQPEQRPTFDDIVALLDAAMTGSVGCGVSGSGGDYYADQQRQISCESTGDNDVMISDYSEAALVTSAGPGREPHQVGSAVLRKESTSSLRVHHDVRSVPNVYSAGPETLMDAAPVSGSATVVGDESEYLDVIVGNRDSVLSKHQEGYMVPRPHYNTAPIGDYLNQSAATNSTGISNKAYVSGPTDESEAAREALSAAPASTEEDYLQPLGSGHSPTLQNGTTANGNTNKLTENCAYLPMSDSTACVAGTAVNGRDKPSNGSLYSIRL